MRRAPGLVGHETLKQAGPLRRFTVLRVSRAALAFMEQFIAAGHAGFQGASETPAVVRP